jgi:hypothetical protein
VIAVFRPARPGDADAVLRCVRILRSVQAVIERRDCGTGSGGFKPGNKCAGGGDGGGADSGGGGSGGGGDSGGAAGSGSVEPAKAGDGPLVKAARDEHKKSLDKLRKNIETAEQKGLGKFMKASDEYFKAKDAHYDVAERAGKLQEDHATLGQRLSADPANETLKSQFAEATRLMEQGFSEMEASEKVMQKASTKREKVRQEMRTAVVRTLRKEVDAVNKEDGFGPRNRDNVEQILSSNAHVAAGMADSYQRTSQEIASRPVVAQEMKTAREFALQAVNPEIHGQAMTTPVRFEESVRAMAQVKEWDHDIDRPPGAMSTPESRSSFTVLSANDSASTHVHEMAHHIEFSTPEVRQLTQDFLDSRTKGEPTVQFATKFSEAGYADDEKGSPDDFKKAFLAAGHTEAYADRLAHYAGKRYEGGLTEVLTMGSELMFRDAKAFARADPEWFDLVSGVMSGRLLSKTREKKRKQLPYREPGNG